MRDIIIQVLLSVKYKTSMSEALSSYIISVLLFQEMIAAGTDLKALPFMVNQIMLKFTSIAELKT